jgi:uncharacterized protein YneF (UPF0154 family)
MTERVRTYHDQMNSYPPLPEGSILVMNEHGSLEVLPPERDYLTLSVIWAIVAFPLGVSAGFLLSRFIS